MAPRGHDEPRDNQKSAEWDRTHFGVVVPLGLVVVVAIVCIVVAALTSAHRADQVALENEQHLLTRSIATHGEWSLRRLRGIIAVDGALRNIDLDGASELVQERLARTLEPMRDHDLIWVVGSLDQLIYAQTGRRQRDRNAAQTSFPLLKSTIDYLRGRTGLPDRVVQLNERRPDAVTASVPDTILLQSLFGRLAVVSTVSIGSPDGPASTAPAPMVMTARFIDNALLDAISAQLRLNNLRMANDPVPQDDQVFNIVDRMHEPVASFAWTPKRPGAEILHSVFPFLGIALAGFALLAGLVLRFMRRTTETITAGENRLRYLALHDPL